MQMCGYALVYTLKFFFKIYKKMTTWLQATQTPTPQGLPRSHAHDYLLLLMTIFTDLIKKCWHYRNSVIELPHALNPGADNEGVKKMKTTRNMNKYYDAPCRVMYRITSGRTRTTLGGYDLIKRMRDSGRLIRAWSTSTGTVIAW